MEWLKSPSFFVYANFLCAQWGDWMWLFASGLYLVHLDDNLLRLAAAFGFAGGGCVLLFGGLIGEWVDRHHRLYVVRVTLFTQNASVMLSAVSVGVALHLEATGHPLWQGPLRHALESFIIGFAILAQLASIGYKISIEKDWVVVIAQGNKAMLANLNAVTRAIDLTAKILAPTCVGLIMSYGSLMLSAIVIACWNLVSVFVEYGMLKIVYKKVPELANKKLRTGFAGEESAEEMQEIKSEEKALNGETTKEADEAATKEEAEPLNTDKEQEAAATEPQEEPKKTPSMCKRILKVMFEPLLMLVMGWKTYARQKVVYASLALAALYMTVMGFDSVTIGYIYSTGLTEWAVGLSMAMAGVTGIISTYIFTRLRAKIGLERTGLIAFNLEILCLTLAIASVWAPGSPFDPAYILGNPSNCSDVVLNATQAGRVQSGLFVIHDGAKKNESRPRRDVSLDHLSSMWMDTGHMRMRRALDIEGPEYSMLATESKDIQINCIDDSIPTESPNISIILFLIGIITSRTGLWMADLVVTQLLQENVIETERGVVNGIQNSLNMLMEMTKFVLVIIFPHVKTFGMLIIISFIFICFAGMLFATHSYRVRGHLFHFEKCLCNNNFGHHGNHNVNNDDDQELPQKSNGNMKSAAAVTV
jgi:iron-regulated transporter 1